MYRNIPENLLLQNMKCMLSIKKVKIKNLTLKILSNKLELFEIMSVEL